jgi:holo-[acyl-carrier protein] synthase
VDSPPGSTGTMAVIGVGTDLVEVERIRAALQRRDGLRRRLYTEVELSYAERHRDPMPHLAARFAAKEAVMKALGQGMDRMSFQEIGVVRDDDGRPSVELTGRAAEVASLAGVVDWHVTLTHTATLAQAVAIAVGGSAPSGGAT